MLFFVITGPRTVKYVVAHYATTIVTSVIILAIYARSITAVYVFKGFG